MKYLFAMALSFALCCSCFAQQCSSKLVDAHSGLPLNNVMVTGTTPAASVLTNSEGAFTISCSPGDTVSIIHEAYQSRTIIITASGSLPSVIELFPVASTLQQVEVNTGYQRIPKERATGSFETIGSKLFNQQVSTSVLERLETIANGLYFDKRTNQSEPRISIRGLSTIQGPVEPLIILNNFPYTGDVNNINPNDIESITILKDAAAASIWGARAGNGVIVITTKRAGYNQPVRMEFNSNISTANKPDLFYYNDISPADMVEVERELFANNYFNTQLNAVGRPALSPVVEILAARAAGQLSATEAERRLQALEQHDLRNDFTKYMYREAINRQYAFTARGGAGKFNWLLSGGYDDNTGHLHNKYKRITTRFENNFKLGERVQVQAGIIYTNTNSSAGKIDYNNIGTNTGSLPIYTAIADSAGNPLPVMRTYRQAYLDTAGSGKLFNWNYYPLTDDQHIRNNNTVHSIIANIGITARLFKGLSADVRYQYETQHNRTTLLYGEQSYFTRNLVNNFSELNYATGTITYNVPRGAILDNNQGRLHSHNLRAQLNYNRSFSRFRLAAILGSDVRESVTTSDAFRTYGYKPGTLGFTPVNYTIAYKQFVTGSADFIPNIQSFTGINNRFISTYANSSLTYHSKYTWSLSARRDASNLFGLHTNDKWTPLWSTGLSWEITKEPFFRREWLPYLKLRSTYGISGNIDAARSASTVLAYTTNSTFTFLPMARIDQFTNRDLRWEKIAMLNIGIDFRAFNNRVGGSIEYYHKKGTDLLGRAPVDYTTVPTNSLIKNVASMKGSGWDLSLNTVNMNGKFTWLTHLNFNTNKDRVTKYNLANRAAANFLTGGLSISAQQGRPVYALYAYRWAGLDPDTGAPQGYIDGKPSTNYAALTAESFPVDSLLYMGRVMPAVFGSMGNTFSWKGFSVSVRISFKMGYHFKRNSIHYANLYSSRRGHGDYALRWQKPGDELFTDVPSMPYPAQSQRDLFYNHSEVLVSRADHIRLQYISAEYDLLKLCKKLPLKQCSIYLNFNNLGILWRANKFGIDPDYRDNVIPASFNTAVGLRLTF